MLSDLRIDPKSLEGLQGRVTVRVNGRDAYGRRAFDVGDRLLYAFYLPRTLGASGGRLCLSTDSARGAWVFPLCFECTEGDYDVYYAAVDTESLCPELYFCRLSVDTVCGRMDAVGGDPFTLCCGDDPWRTTFQLTLSRYAHPAPDWAKGGVIYHVFVDRFFRGREEPISDGAYLVKDWENGIPDFPPYPGAPLKNNNFFGGDLWGVLQKLPHIASLGTRVIYLSPIFRAASNHKYDTGDYMEVDEMFGGLAALTALIAEAERYGIRIVLDGVFNHTGADSRYFNRYGRYDTVGAYQSPDSPYAGWYHFTEFPSKYEAWWGIEILPRLMLTNPDCRRYFLGDGGVIDRYAALGIGGMRLDVADELDGDFISGIKARLAARTADSILYGEVWEDASNKIAYGRRCRYYLGDQLDAVMNYPLREGLIAYIRHRDVAPLAYYFSEVLPNMPKRAADLAMNFLGTHDTVRILTALAAPSAEGRSNAELAVLRMSEEERRSGIDLLLGAYLVLGTLPGIPSIYYGDEAGMEGYSDPFNRLPYPWHRVEERLLARYRLVGELRRHPLYADGEFRLLRLDAELLVFSRENATQAAVTVFNNGDTPRRLGVPAEARCLLGDGAADAVPPHDALVYEMPRPARFFVE